MNEEEKGKVIKCLDNGEWVNTSDVQQALGIDFADGLKRFDFSRTAEWWSVVGKTEEERAYEGQKVTTKFRLKQN